MSSTTFPSIPMDTVRAAEAVFGKSNQYLVIGEQANELFAGLSLKSPLDSSQRSFHRFAALYLITIFQHLETLPDQFAIDALRERLDWKYALHSPLNPSPWEAITLCEFRRVLLADPVSKDNLQKLLVRLASTPQVTFCACLQMDAVQVVSHVCRISRLANIWEAINQAIETLAVRQPEWLRSNSLPHWYERYGHVRRSLNLRADRQEQEAFAQEIGGDGFYLLAKISSSGLPEMANLPEVSALRKVWNEQFEHIAGNAIWRKEVCAGCTAASRGQITSLEISRSKRSV